MPAGTPGPTAEQARGTSVTSNLRASRAAGVVPHNRSSRLLPNSPLDDAIARVRAVIDQHLVAEQEVIARLDIIPEVRQRTAEILMADMGTDRCRFPRAKHLAS
jgi:hypothetical protein